ncbi:MAG: hypothetical protein E2O56_03465, partial [Gammaproteobacteria bacterium]
MRKAMAHALAIAVLLSGFMFPGTVGADDVDKSLQPIKLKLVSPLRPRGAESDSIQWRSGWPLVFKLIIKNHHLLGTYVPGGGNPVSAYPEAGEPSWLIFDDSDDCLYLELQAFFLGFDCDPDPGERFLAFNLDVDFPGTVDIFRHGRGDVRDQLADETGRPEWGGPRLSEGILDGVGYGPNDDLPGFVLISDVGVGVVYDPVCFVAPGGKGKECVVPPSPGKGLDPMMIVWARTFPEARRNLSGMMGMVGYELSDERARTTVMTSLLVPRYLFSHMEIFDQCVGVIPPSPPCDAEANQIDGGPINSPPVANFITIFELRAFVVNGAAPAV